MWTGNTGWLGNTTDCCRYCVPPTISLSELRSIAFATDTTDGEEPFDRDAWLADSPSKIDVSVGPPSFERTVMCHRREGGFALMMFFVHALLAARISGNCHEGYDRSFWTTWSPALSSSWSACCISSTGCSAEISDHTMSLEIAMREKTH